jgi:hypothetical protein
MPNRFKHREIGDAVAVRETARQIQPVHRSQANNDAVFCVSAHMLAGDFPRPQTVARFELRSDNR